MLSEHATLETQLSQLTAYKPLLDSTRESLSNAESRCEELLVAARQHELDVREANLRITRLETEKKNFAEVNRGLEERLAEMEQEMEMGMPQSAGSLAGEMGTSSSASPAGGDQQKLYVLKAFANSLFL